MFTREELLAEKARRNAIRNGGNAKPSAPGMNFTREELLAEKERRSGQRASIWDRKLTKSAPIPTKQAVQDGPKPEKNMVRRVGEGLLSGALSWADLAQMFGKGATMEQHRMADLGMDPDEVWEGENQKPASETIANLSKDLGADIQSQGPGDTKLERFATAASRGVGAGGVFGPMGAVLGGAQGLGGQGLQELGLPPLASDIVSGVATAFAPTAIRGAAKAIKGTYLNDAERRLAEYYQRTMGPEGAKRAAENINLAPQYPITGYEPMTAEVANEVLPSQLHRLRFGVPGSGLPQRANQQHGSLTRAIHRESAGAMTTPELSEAVSRELVKRKATRHEATHGRYQTIKGMKEPIKLKHTKKYLRESDERGVLRDDINYAKKQIRPTERLLADEAKEAKEAYKTQRDSLEETIKFRKNLGVDTADLEKQLTEMGKLKTPPLTISEAAAAKRAITAKMEGLKNTPQTARLTVLGDTKRALKKDLSKVPFVEETSDIYRELSRPVNEILKHPVIKKIPESRSNNIFNELFSKDSTKNFSDLRKVLGDNPQEWEGVQRAVINHMDAQLGNVGARGAGNAISYAKLRKFIQKHGEALGEVLTPDQIEFVNELSYALHGENIANSLGAGVNSLTAERFMTDVGLKHNLGSKITEATTHFVPSKLGGGPFRYMLNRWSLNKQADVWKVLDASLIDPALFHRLLTTDFKSHADFAKQMSNLMAISTKNRIKEKKDEKEED